MDRREFLATVGAMAGGITLWPNQVLADHLQTLQPKGERPAPPRSVGAPVKDVPPVNLVWAFGACGASLSSYWADTPQRAVSFSPNRASYELHQYARIDDDRNGLSYTLVRTFQADGRYVYGVGSPLAWALDGFQEDSVFLVVDRGPATPEQLLGEALKRLGVDGSWSINRSYRQHPDGTREPIPVYYGYENHWKLPSESVQNPA